MFGLRAELAGPLCSLLCALSRVRLFATLQAPLSDRFSRQEYWSGLPFPSPGGLPDPGIKLVSLLSPALAGGFFTSVPPGELCCLLCYLGNRKLGGAGESNFT